MDSERLAELYAPFTIHWQHIAICWLAEQATSRKASERGSTASWQARLQFTIHGGSGVDVHVLGGWGEFGLIHLREVGAVSRSC